MFKTIKLKFKIKKIFTPKVNYLKDKLKQLEEITIDEDSNFDALYNDLKTNKKFTSKIAEYDEVINSILNHNKTVNNILNAINNFDYSLFIDDPLSKGIDDKLIFFLDVEKK